MLTMLRQKKAAGLEIAGFDLSTGWPFQKVLTS